MVKPEIKENNIRKDSQKTDTGWPADSYFAEIDGHFFWQSKKIDGDEVVHYSSNILSVTGYTREEMKHFPGRGNALIHAEDLYHVKKDFNEFAGDASRSKARFIYRIVKKDESVAWIDESVFIKRNPDGTPLEFFGIVSDITELKTEDLDLKNLLENYKELNSSKDKFISMLSHDLRAPFTSILGFAEILINEPELSSKERQEYLSYINDSSQNQLQLINYLLDWSRLQMGRIKIEPLRLNAQAIVYNCISLQTGNTIRKKLEINVNIKESIYVEADERLLTQVITNLLSNAIKFSEDGKSIDVSADIFNERFIEFVIKDNGIGIPEENKSKLFKIEKMFTTGGTKGEKGTGLGLSLVREIVEKHGGEVWFYSEKGKGSEFHFTIPCSQNTVLLIENDPRVIRKIEKIIREDFPNFVLKTVTNGYEAVKMVAHRLPSLLITAFDLPLMNGGQLVKEVRKDDKNFKMPVIIIAEAESEGMKYDYSDLKIAALIQKPIDEESFSDKMRYVLNLN